MKKINYKSDFLLIINLGAVTSGRYADEITVGVIEKLAVSGRLMSSCCDDDYVVGGRDYKFSIGAHEQQGINCHRDRGGRLVVVVDNHRLHPGELMMELEVMKPDGMFADGVQSIFKRVSPDVELVRGGGDCCCTVPSIDVVMPWVEVSAYDMAVAGGYGGTQSEFISDLIKACQLDTDEYCTKDEVRELDTKHAADTDAIRRDFIGVWDEIDHVKELLASVATNEVRDCLRQLNFDDDAINDYIYFNLHGYCNVTMDELRLSAWRWTHRDELEALPELYVLPHFSDEEWGKVRYLSDMFQPRHSVKYVSYWWNDSFSPYGGDGVLDSNCFVANLFVANLKYQSGEFTDDASIGLGWPYQFYNINGYIEKVYGQGYWAHLDTIADTITFDRGALSGRTIKGSEPFVAKLRPYIGMFYYATIEDAKIGAWDLSDSDPGLQPFEGAIIKNSDIALDFAGGTAQYKLFYQTTLINSKINLMNLPDESWNGPYMTNGVVEALVDSNVGGGAESVTTITSDIDGRVYVDNIPCASAAECGAVIYDMPNLNGVFLSNGVGTFARFEDDVEYHRSGQYWRCFLKNIGANIETSLDIYRMFSLTTTNPDMQPAVQNNLELFIECSRTWYDRTAAGLDAVSVCVTRKFMNLLPDEDKAMLVNKGYRLVEIDESFYAQ